MASISSRLTGLPPVVAPRGRTARRPPLQNHCLRSAARSRAGFDQPRKSREGKRGVVALRGDSLIEVGVREAARRRGMGLVGSSMSMGNRPAASGRPRAPPAGVRGQLSHPLAQLASRPRASPRPEAATTARRLRPSRPPGPSRRPAGRRDRAELLVARVPARRASGRGDGGGRGPAPNRARRPGSPAAPPPPCTASGRSGRHVWRDVVGQGAGDPLSSWRADSGIGRQVGHHVALEVGKLPAEGRIAQIAGRSVREQAPA